MLTEKWMFDGVHPHIKFQIYPDELDHYGSTYEIPDNPILTVSIKDSSSPSVLSESVGLMFLEELLSEMKKVAAELNALREKRRLEWEDRTKAVDSG